MSKTKPVRFSTRNEEAPTPMDWPLWVKIGVLTQTSLLAAIGGLNTAAINPALVPLANDFHISRVRASYQTTVCIALNGIAPWFWIPLAHKYGRRPVWLATTLLAFISILGCAYAKTYTQLIIARIFNGFFPVGFALGATTVVDLFPFHQRGRAMGFFTVTVVNGSHLAPIIGGLLGQYSGWRWIFKFLAIVDATLLVTAFFLLPETGHIIPAVVTTTTVAAAAAAAATKTDPLPARNSTTATPELTSGRGECEKGSPVKLARTDPVSGKLAIDSLAITRSTSSLAPASSRPDSPLPAPSVKATYSRQSAASPFASLPRYLRSLRLITLDPNYRISLRSSIMSTLRLCRSPSAIFPAVYYASMYGFASILPAVTVAAIFTEFFGWNTLTIGLTYGAALTIGGILGEAVSGWVCDVVVKREQVRLEVLSHAEAEHATSRNTILKMRPEVRLRPIWTGALLTPIGLLIYGFTLQYHLHPALPIFGMGLSCFGLQIITTCTYTYSIDCHTDTFVTDDGDDKALTKSNPSPTGKERGNSQQNQDQLAVYSSTGIIDTRHPVQDQEKAQEQEQEQAAPPAAATTSTRKTTKPKATTTATATATAAEVAQLFNLIRQTFGFTFAFYVVHLGDTIGYQWTFSLFTVCGGVLAFLPVVFLIFRPRFRWSFDNNNNKNKKEKEKENQ